VVARNGTAARVDLGFAQVEIKDAPPEESVKIGLHGEHIRIARSGGGLRGTVTDVRYLGEATRCLVRVGAATLVANVSPREVVRAGDDVSLDIEPSSWIGLRP
jgi:ABC-type Fe3+/spermidine/putrescine transport system ATPase subunit